MLVIDQRKEWRKRLEGGWKPDIYYLEDYRYNRNNPYWRSTKSLEILCEYVLFLEEKVNELSKLETGQR